MATGYQANVVAGAPIASSWGNTIRDRSVMVFATVAERDSSITTPTAGMTCFITATNTLFIHNGVSWWPYPRGMLAQGSATANTGVTTTNVTWITLPSVTLDGIRRVKLTAYGVLQCAGAIGDTAALEIMEGATGLQSGVTRFSVTGGGSQTPITLVTQFVPTAAAHVYSVRIRQVAGTGVLGAATANMPANLILEEIGA